ncbi:MAG TPA: xanthine dehydrogenase family protein subunit M [Thermoanaerobaculia bacterium]|nr:xanthine dehydrogenase family protein subunit M [Thermoanaerobaculia bacterium]
MIPASFEYASPKTLSEAISLLEKHGEDAKILAGGQSLIPLMKLRLASPKFLIDVNGIKELSYIKESDGYLTIGALTRESDLDSSDLIRKKYPIIADTAAVIADPLVRNMATVGGNLAHADPANDHPATMLVLGTEIVAQGPKGTRKIPITDFFTGLFTTALHPDEILTEIRIPTPPARSGGAYLKVERKVGDFAAAAVAVQVTLEGETLKRVGIGLTNVGPTPIKASRAEKALQGKPADEKNIQEAARIASEEAEPADDLRGSVEYKRSLIRVLTARALKQAIARAKGEH